MFNISLLFRNKDKTPANKKTLKKLKPTQTKKTTTAPQNYNKKPPQHQNQTAPLKNTQNTHIKKPKQKTKEMQRKGPKPKSYNQIGSNILCP